MSKKIRPSLHADDRGLNLYRMQDAVQRTMDDPKMIASYSSDFQ